MNRSHSRKLSFRPTLETLENRSMLSAGGLLGGIKAAIQPPKSLPPPAISAKAAPPALSAHSETHLTATLSGTGTTATGSVNFESETEHGQTHASLVVRVSGEKAGTVINVSVTPTVGGAAIPLGTITVGADGTGKLVVKSNPKATTTFPDGVLPLAAGATITLDNGLSGTLAKPTGGGHDHGDENEVALAGKLTGTAGATGSAAFHSETENGVTKKAFSVKVSGATAGATLNVAISPDGVAPAVVVGTITVLSDGTGTLVFSSNPVTGKSVAFPDNFPTSLAAGATVTVTDSTSGATIVSGALAAKSCD